ncbi:MAG: carboxylating nicotinate-nucleotide diphosphorylase [Actinomycetota bacterium]
MNPQRLDLDLVRSLVKSWLAEDVGRGDATTLAVVPPDRLGRARLEAREPAVVAGLDVARTCFEVASEGGVAWEAKVQDGQEVATGDVLAFLDGPLGPILTAERTALNGLARLCGVATITRLYVDAVSGTRARVVDTRKTTPGLRALQKYAVRVGGGANHRFGLDDGVLIKDNHVAAAGGVGEAVRRASTGAGHGLRVEVEVTTLDELDEALAAGADAILLDNMTPETVAQAVQRTDGRALLEVSGGVTLDTIRAYAETDVDLISVGALTHSAPTIDLALEVEQ